MSGHGQIAARDSLRKSRCSPHNNAPRDVPHSLHEQLYVLAQQAMRCERPEHTLQPSALLNEAWIRLQQQENLDPARRAHYLAAAAETMRRVLVDHAKKKQRLKRGGPDLVLVSLDAFAADGGLPAEELLPPIDMLALDEALTELARLHKRAAKVVELRFFGGLTPKQIADEIEIALGTVQHDWQFAKAWLYRALDKESDLRE